MLVVAMGNTDETVGTASRAAVGPAGSQPGTLPPTTEHTKVETASFGAMLLWR
jgi:hypothetical protein